MRIIKGILYTMLAIVLMYVLLIVATPALALGGLIAGIFGDGALIVVILVIVIFFVIYIITQPRKR